MWLLKLFKHPKTKPVFYLGDVVYWDSTLCMVIDVVYSNDKKTFEYILFDDIKRNMYEWVSEKELIVYN